MANGYDLMGGQGATVPTANQADPTAVQALQKKKPEQVTNALQKSKEHATNVMQGADPLTQQIMTQQSEQSAAKSAARLGAEAQRAELSGASQSTQNILSQLTGRDIEQQRQQGVVDMVSNLGQRADQQSAQLANIGQFEVQQDLSERQFAEQQEQFDETLGFSKEQFAEQQKQNEITNQQWEDKFGFEKGVYQKSQSEKEFDLMLTTSDLTNPDDIDALNAYREENELPALSMAALKNDAFTAKEAEYEAKLINDITVDVAKGMYIGSDGTVDLNAAVDSNKSALENLWQAETKGLMGDYDSDNANHRDWAKDKVKGGTMSATQTDLVTYNNDVANFKLTDTYANATETEKAAWDEVFKQGEVYITAGGLGAFDDNGNFVVTDPSGTELFTTELVADKAGNTYDLNETGDGVTMSDGDGAETEWVKNADDEWIVSGTDATTYVKTDSDIDSATSDQIKGYTDSIDNGAYEGGRYRSYDSDTGIFSIYLAETGAVSFKKVDGEWVEIDPESAKANIVKATEDQKKYLDNTLDGTDPNEDSYESIVDETLSEDGGVAVPEGKEATGSVFESDSKTYINGVDGVIELNPSTMTVSDINDIVRAGSLGDAGGVIKEYFDTGDANLGDLSEESIRELFANSETKDSIINLTQPAKAVHDSKTGGGDGSSPGQRTKFGFSRGGGAPTSGFVNYGDSIYEITGDVSDVDYEGRGRPDGDVKKVSKNHHGQTVKAIDLTTGEEVLLVAILAADRRNDYNDIDFGGQTPIYV